MTFHDSASNSDIHNYRLTLSGNPNQSIASPGILTGNWAPDGRNTSPLSVYDTAPRSSTLETFLGHSIAGEWTLFVADLSEGGAAKLTSWGLEFAAIPEPSACGMLVAVLLGVAALARRGTPSKSKLLED